MGLAGFHGSMVVWLDFVGLDGFQCGDCGRDRAVFLFGGLCWWSRSIGLLMAVAWVSQWLCFIGLLLWLWVGVVVVVGCGNGVVIGFGMILGGAFWLWDGFCGVDVVDLLEDLWVC